MSRFSVGVILGIGCGLAGCHVVFSSDGSKQQIIDANGDAVVDAQIDALVDAKDVEPNLAFISSVSILGNFGGITAADALCNQFAVQAGFAPNFVAVLGNPAAQPYSALKLLAVTGSRGWIRTDHAFVANTVNDFTAGRLLNAIVLDENGKRPPETTIWTGLDASGDPLMDNCTGFSVPNGTGMLGDTSSLSNLLKFAPGSCATPHRLLCISVGKQVVSAPLPPSPSSKRIFLSKRTFSGSAGLMAFDKQCADEALLPLASTNFVALLPTTTESALARAGLADSQLFTRVDGTLVDRLSAPPLTFLNQHADGTFPLIGSAAEVWTGGQPFQIATSGQNCDNWISTVGNARIGSANLATSNAYFLGLAGPQPCTGTPRHVYCVEK